MSKSPWRQESYHDVEDESDSPVEKKRRVVSGDELSPFEEEVAESCSREEASRDSLEHVVQEEKSSTNVHQELEFCSKCATAQEGEGYEVSTGGVSGGEVFDDVDDPLFWGPYLSERQWGTVREDFSEHDNSWEHISHEDAVGHAYVSGEDGLLGVSDRFQLFCASLALWNGKDCMLKERLFGLTGVEGNHGEDVKELYYYLDNTPDHSYMRALYKYPQGAFPYSLLREENKRRSQAEPEFELLDTGIFEVGGHWDVTVEYIKTDHLGLACRVMAINNSDDEQAISIIPQFLLRNVCRGREPIPHMSGRLQPLMSASSDGSVQVHYQLGHWRIEFLSEDCPDGCTLLFTDNRSAVCKKGPEHHSYTKDAFHRYIVQGKLDAVNPARFGTKCGALHRVKARAGGHVAVYWRIEAAHTHSSVTIDGLRQMFLSKRNEALKYYDSVFGSSWSSEERNVAVQALAGLFWSKQYFCFDVKTWLRDYRKCRQNKGRKARNSAWGHVLNHDILLMPDKWEFPWYAGWDLCVSAVLYARYDAKFAKQQMLTFLSDNYMNTKGQLPGCEFELDVPNPPLQPWACLHIFRLDGSVDIGFLKRCFHRLLLNYVWWCTLEKDNTRTYGRGFLGMDNISVIDRSGPLPDGWTLVQSDCTAWVACFCLWMLQIAMELGRCDPTYLDLLPKFLNHFVEIAAAINQPITEMGLWHAEDQFFYDVFHTDLDTILPIRLRSWTGLIPLFAAAAVNLPSSTSLEAIVQSKMAEYPQHVWKISENEVFLSLLPMKRVQVVLQQVFCQEEFLGTFGIRSLSQAHSGEGYQMKVGEQICTVGYAPGESDSCVFGGNSNWRGPVWLFMNYLLLESLDCYSYQAVLKGGDLQLYHLSVPPGTTAPLSDIITDLARRLVSIFLPGSNGRRPVHGSATRYAADPKWRHLVLFYEFFHADSGRGCGASHQTGWTATVIELLLRLNAGHGSKQSRSS